MARMDQVDLKSLARMGAVTRIAELEREIAALKRAFPGLTVLSVDVVEARAPHAAAAARVAEKVAKKGPKSGARKKVRRGRQTPMTEAERQAVSDRMKQYWASKQAEKKAKGDKKTEG